MPASALSSSGQRLRRAFTGLALAASALLGGCSMLRTPMPSPGPAPVLAPAPAPAPAASPVPVTQIPAAPAGQAAPGAPFLSPFPSPFPPSLTPPFAQPAEPSAPASRPGEVSAARSPAPLGIARPRPSQAPEPRAYRKDAAQHLYLTNKDRIYPGKLPPLLYAIGVLDVEVDGRGEVQALSWQRAPRHAPEVIAEIERTVRAAAPYPAPARMGRVVYTDVWLWDRSGRFQLDTLSEGQY